MSAMATVSTPFPLIKAAQQLRRQVGRLVFEPPVHTVYNPLDYAWAAHEQFLDRFGRGRKRVVFLGMNPGPWGMAQTGVPFGEIPAVRDWMGIDAPIARPQPEHPKRPIEGLACRRSEVSGRRLWGLFQERFGTAEAFFTTHFVLNYCPLVFMHETGKNLTPDKLPAAERLPLEAICDQHLRDAVEALRPEVLVGVGGFATKRAEIALGALATATRPRLATILHPSPASPAANRGWAEQAVRQMIDQGVWS